MRGGLFLRTTVEALESVSSPSVAHAIVSAALAAAGLTDVPDEIAPFRAFVEGPLQSQVERQLGAASVSHLLERLGHVLWMATSDVHALDIARNWVGLNKPPATSAHDVGEESGEFPAPSARPAAIGTTHKRPTVPAPELASSSSVPPRQPSPLLVPRPPAPAVIGRVTVPKLVRADARPLPTCVLMVTLDPTLTTQATDEIAGRCKVVRIATPAELARVASSSGDRLVVLVDTALPSIDLRTFVGLAPILPAGSRVVLWGADERQRARLASMFPIAADWIASADSTSPGVLALAQV